MNPRKTLSLALAAGTALSGGLSAHAATAVATVPVEAHAFHQADLPLPAPLVMGWQYEDQNGKHLVALMQSADAKTSRRAAKATGTAAWQGPALYAVSWRLKGARWVAEWALRDGVECPELDAEARFVLPQVTTLDADDDGVAEVYLPYKLLCGGGVDPKTLKVIMRSGEQKLAVRGSTRVILPDQAPAGGDYQLDEALDLPANKPFRRQLMKLWQQTYLEKPGAP
ncbi:hypothetical protein EYS42_02190 [Aquabacterium lacunae]|uniref:Uncharacterized protein n=1 Tax=Aquabacterium lacunae TaxID=2528630 RepID=A0A4Q9H5U2_9BURK|nr:hypothetical protein [Aquabacterium lacunae]TBO34260.1 hypothetical protein EYS42_02190 [Aquabacterium lacunae]